MQHKLLIKVLSGIEGLLVLPITECSLEEDKERVDNLRRKSVVPA